MTYKRLQREKPTCHAASSDFLLYLPFCTVFSKCTFAAFTPFRASPVTLYFTEYPKTKTFSKLDACAMQ